MQDQITVLGGYGFVGSEFYKHSLKRVHRNEKLDYIVKTNSVINFISTVDNYNIHTNPFLDIDTNLTVLIKTLESWRKNNPAGVYNLISSWFVYGQDSGFGTDRRGIPETDPCNPKGFYSITKRCAEQLLISYCETYGLQYRILRLANVLGKGDNKVSAKKNALQFLIEQLKQDKPIVLYDSGQFYRDYIDVRDCARAIDIVLHEGAYNSIYNIGNGNPIVFSDIINYAKLKISSNSEINIIEQKPFHKIVQTSRSFYMDNTKLKSLGYYPYYSVYDTINTLIEG